MREKYWLKESEAVPSNCIFGKQNQCKELLNWRQRGCCLSSSLMAATLLANVKQQDRTLYRGVMRVLFHLRDTPEQAEFFFGGNTLNSVTWDAGGAAGIKDIRELPGMMLTYPVS